MRQGDRESRRKEEKRGTEGGREARRKGGKEARKEGVWQTRRQGEK